MKMYKNIILSLLFLGGMISCTTDDGPSIDDYYLNYQIEEIPVSADIPVGTYLVNPSGAFTNADTWQRLTQPYDPANGQVGPYLEPALGQYSLSLTEDGTKTMQQLYDWAADAKIDFFVTPAIRETSGALYPNNLVANDSLLLNLIRGNAEGLTVNTNNIKYSILLDLNTFCSGLSNNALLENVDSTSYKVDGVTIKLSREDRLYNYMKRISDYFSDENYYHVDGKPMIVLSNPEKLYTADSRKVYDKVREVIKTHTGKDVYIVARQIAWTPPARFHYFFMTGGVDAVTMQCMTNVGASYYDRLYWINQLINENLKYNREYIATNYNIDFIPTASPSYNGYVPNGNFNIPHVFKDPDEFKKRCNVAKMNLGKKQMVLIDSFNNWQYDTQIEPSKPDYGNGYGTTYLDIVKQQFKK